MATGILALALAAAYFIAADALPRSLLSDQVGADGVPKVLALALGLLGVMQIARPVVLRAARAGDGDAPAHHVSALGLLLIGAAYAVAAPYLGYLVSTTALLLATAAYAGARWSARMVAICLAGGVGLWLVFAKLLGVSMPAGPLERLLG
ncbi:MAG: tripartite tricarboxylate transporter TctB family protein [Rhodospirillales bacterium]